MLHGETRIGQFSSCFLGDLGALCESPEFSETPFFTAILEPRLTDTPSGVPVTTMPDSSTLRCVFCLLAAMSWSALVPAQDEPRGGTDATERRWTGQWSAEGLPFTVQVQAHAGSLKISPVAPPDQTWVARNGRISGDSATVEIEYQEVTATALIQLMEDDTAIARALSCRPDYHVICTLARNQQVRFKRLPTPAGE